MSTGPESNLYKRLKKRITEFEITRLESRTGLGIPDCLVAVPFEEDGKTFKFFLTLELKVTTTRSLRISPHQVAFHVKHKDAPSLILVYYAPTKFDTGNEYFLFHGRQVMDLMVMGLDTPPLFRVTERFIDWKVLKQVLLDSIYVR